MYRITLFGRDKSKQITHPADSFGLDQWGQRLTDEKLKEKVATIGQTVLGGNYYDSLLEFIY